MLKVPVEEAPRNSFATQSWNDEQLPFTEFLLSFLFQNRLTANQRPCSSFTVFQAASWKLREEFVLAFIVWHGLMTVVHVSLRHACIILIFKSKPVGPKMPSSFRFSVRASHRCGSEPIEWLAGISSRKVDSGFACHGFVFKRFHASPRTSNWTGFLVLDRRDSSWRFDHDGQVFISNMIWWALSPIEPCFLISIHFFKRAATFRECSLLGKVFTPVALVTVPVAGWIWEAVFSQSVRAWCFYWTSFVWTLPV